jgi:protein SCO1/2
LKKIKAIAVLFILLLPLFFYVFLKQGTHHYRLLQFYGPKQLIPNSKDTLYHTIADFEFTNPNGQKIGFHHTTPSYWVFHFFNSSCLTPCSEVFKNVYDVVRDFGTAPKVKFLSITTMPQTDSIDKLLTVQKLNSVNPPQWQLCTGDSLQIDSLMRFSFLMQQPNNAALNLLFLVDQNKHLRGIYDGENLMEIRRLKDEIKILSYENKQKQH